MNRNPRLPRPKPRFPDSYKESSGKPGYFGVPKRVFRGISGLGRLSARALPAGRERRPAPLLSVVRRNLADGADDALEDSPRRPSVRGIRLALCRVGNPEQPYNPLRRSGLQGVLACVSTSA